MPAAITIPAGASSAVFEISAVDDAIVDGSQPVVVQAVAAGYAGAAGALHVHDNDTPTLTLSIDTDSISEQGGIAHGTVHRNTIDGPLLVSLSSDDATEATTPSFVTIPAGVASATFDITGVDDAVVDGGQIAAIAATAQGYVGAVSGLQVTDNDTPTLTLSLDADRVSENGGIAHATVHRNTIDGSLTVAVSLDDATEADAPQLVTIPAGASQATFDIIGLDDAIVDGVQAVTIAVAADGHAAADARLVVDDDDTPTLTLAIDADSISEQDGVATATVHRNTIDGPLAVSLSSSDADQAGVPASVTIPAGSMAVTFEIVAVDDTIVDGSQTISVTAVADGHSGDSVQLTVVDNDVRPPEPPIETPLVEQAQEPNISNQPVPAFATQEVNVMDVSGDGQITPLDVLIIVNHLNGAGGGVREFLPEFARLDINGDNAVTPMDVLKLINHLNASSPQTSAADAVFQQSGEAEGEAQAELAPVTSAAEEDVLVPKGFGGQVEVDIPGGEASTDAIASDDVFASVESWEEELLPPLG